MKIVPFVSVVIVTFNGADYVDKCIKSVISQDYPHDSYEIIVVDNASSDSTVDKVKSFKEVKLIQNNKNVGFGHANNIVFKQCRGEFAVLLNQDSWVENNFLSQLVGVMSKNDKIGICGAAEHPFDKTLPSSRITEETDWIGCGATIVRLSAVKAVDLFDENYFMYQEDIDLSLKLRCNGWKVYYHPFAIWHHAGRERKLEQTDFRIVESSVSRIYFVLKFGSFKQIMRSFRLYLRLTKTSRGISQGEAVVKEPVKNKRSFILAILLKASLKIIQALINRWKVRRSSLFDQGLIDIVIRETDEILYTN